MKHLKIIEKILLDILDVLFPTNEIQNSGFFLNEMLPKEFITTFENYFSFLILSSQLDH
jgi:hypothetical protein